VTDDDRYSLADMSSMRCPICGSAALELFEMVLRGSVATALHRCSGCEFTFFPDPDWLQGSFGSQLNRLDVGAVARCESMANLILGLLPVVKKLISDHKILDWGGGDGLLTRMLRDRGINCYWEDPYCEERYAWPAIAKPDDTFDLVLAVEVFLHIPDPLPVLRQLLDRADVVIFTAVRPPQDLNQDWWYLMPRTGQHVSFFPQVCCERLARLTNSHYYSDGRFVHAFTRRPLSFTARMRISSRTIAAVVALVRLLVAYARLLRHHSRSLTPVDHDTSLP